MTGSLPSQLFAGSYRALKGTLISHLLEEISLDPLSEKIVLLPSNYLAGDIYGTIGRKLEKPALNLRFLSILDFAKLILKHCGILPREIEHTTRTMMLSGLLSSLEPDEDTPFLFGRKNISRGIVTVLLRLFDELEEGMISPGEGKSLLRTQSFLNLFPDPAKIRDLLSLYVRFMEHVKTRGVMTRSAIIRLAAEKFETPGYPFRVRLYGFYDFTRLQWLLVMKLIDSGLLEEIYFPLPLKEGVSGNQRLHTRESQKEAITPLFRYAFPALSHFLHHFDGNITFLEEEGERSEANHSFKEKIVDEKRSPSPERIPFYIISAPHVSGELRAVARRIKEEEKEGIRGKRRALIYRSLDEDTVYDVGKIFEEFNMPCEIVWSLPLLRSAPIRTLFMMIRLPFERYPRRSTIDTLTSPCLNRESLSPGSEVFVPLFENISKSLSITGGEEWKIKIDHYLQGRPKRNSTLQEEVDRGGADRYFRGAYSLLLSLHALQSHLDTLLLTNSFQEFASHVEELLTTLIRINGTDETRALQKNVVKKMTKILKCFGELESKEALFPGAAVAVDLLEKVCAEETVQLHNPGFARKRTGTVIGDIFSLRGMTFDEIHIMRMNEGVWPALRSDEGLLRDDEREIVRAYLRAPSMPPVLPLRRDNLPEEKLLYCLPLLMCTQIRSISYLRSTLSGKEQIPSPFLGELLFRYRGPDLYTKGYTGEVLGDSFYEFPRQLKGRLAFAGIPSVREENLAQLFSLQGQKKAHIVVPPETSRCIERSVKLESRRLLGKDLAPLPASLDGAPAVKKTVNHTFLHNYITCPYKTYLRYGLSLDPLQEPEEIFSLGPMEKGIIVHRVLQILYSEKEQKGEFPVTADTVRQVIDEFGRNHPSGLEGLLHVTWREITRVVEAFIAWERGTETGTKPSLFEVTFGMGGRYRTTISLGGDTYPFSGKIDRIDTAKGRVRVLDYKFTSGSQYYALPEKIAIAFYNQIPLYITAAKKILEEEGKTNFTIEGGYIALKAPRNDRYLHIVPFTENSPLLGKWREALSLLLSSLSGKSYPPMPDRDYPVEKWNLSYCSTCAYKDLCRVSPATKGTEHISSALRRNLFSLYPSLSWHAKYRGAGE